MDPEVISEIKGRKVLHWNFRGLTELPIELKYHGDQVEDMYLKWNNFTTLPTWIKDLKLLTNLYLYGNGLQYLPDEIGELTLLNTLSLENNKLTTLPKAVWKLKNLNYLNLELNCIEILPPEVGHLKALYVLNMKGNGLKNLPAAVCSLNSLQELILDCNRLTHLPRNIVYLPNINYLSIKDNNLLFLPSIWFISNPQVHFTHNPYLNYLSYEWGCALTRKGDLVINGNIWCFNISGCITKNSDPENVKYHTVIYVDEKVLVLPSVFRRVSCAKSSHVTSLLEMTLRKVYTFLFIKKDIRQCLNPNILQLFPQEIQQLFWQGPAAHCSFCKQPLFMECALLIILKYVLSDNDDMQNRILACLYFCNNTCCILFSENESQNGNQIEYMTNRLEWVQYNNII